MATSTYENALHIAESLNPDEQQRLLRELMTRVAANSPAEPKYSIMEFCGLGAELWKELMPRNTSIANGIHGMAKQAIRDDSIPPKPI